MSSLGRVPSFDQIWAVISVIGAIAGIGLIEAEEAAREHFDRTGRWPDED